MISMLSFIAILAAVAIAGAAGQQGSPLPFASVQAYLDATPNLSKFATSVRGTKLAALFSADNSSLTVFAPTDAAWIAIISATSSVTLTQRLTLLQYHVSQQYIDRSNLTHLRQIPTLADGLSFKVDLKLRTGSILLQARYSYSTIVSSVKAGKSVIHVLDAVLLPFPLSTSTTNRPGVATETLSILNQALKGLPGFLLNSGGSVSKAVTATGAQLYMLSTPRPQPVQRQATPLTNDSAIPASPYTPDKSACGQGTSYQVYGYNSSPVAIVPFTRPFKNPTFAAPAGRVCRSDSHCMTVFELNAEETELDLGCPKKTRVLTFNGSVPGPTILAPVGEEILVRFNNKMAGGVLTATGEGQCADGGDRTKGLPLSVHNHGQPTLAAWDGWAENELCPGETKDYLYPNNRPNTAWYHDHSLGLTTTHVLHGLAGFYIPSIKRGMMNNCGEPWNLDTLPDFHLMLGDKRFNAECQLDLDIEGVDFDNFYGDVNMVSGIPWPVLTLHPTFVRLRLLNAALSRPYKIFLADSTGKNVGAELVSAGPGTLCRVIASDGGFLPEPVNMPAEGIFLGVAERYELVCDLRLHAGQTLYLWNADDEKRSSGNVPFFCYSHLLMQVKVLETCPLACNLPAAPLPLSPTGADVLCGGGCYKRGPTGKGPCSNRPADDQKFACCPVGQFCLRQNATHHVCRATAQPAPTCWLPGDPEPTQYGLRCGGACFRDADCKSAPEARACCPKDQFCWHADANNWYCRPNPPAAPPGTEPPPDAQCSLPQPEYPTSPRPNIMDAVLTQTDYNDARAMVAAGKAHRFMAFDKSGGAWTINGQTWSDFKVAANNVGVGTWEVWKMTVNGGWYHPVHIHLVDFWIISRSTLESMVYPYEARAPKDVISLSPGEEAYLLIRWGPHRGDYMFHCHNLVHEDRLMLRAVSVVEAATSVNAVSAQMGNGSTVDYTLLSAATTVVYDDYKAKDPMSVLPTTTPPALVVDYLQTVLDANNYRIFYPVMDTDDAALTDAAGNPWKVQLYRGGDTCPPDGGDTGETIANGPDTSLAG